MFPHGLFGRRGIGLVLLPATLGVGGVLCTASLLCICTTFLYGSTWRPYSRADATRPWTKFPVQMDVTGYHHNTAGGFASLRPALYAAGNGEARISNLRYRAID